MYNIRDRDSVSEWERERQTDRQNTILTFINCGKVYIIIYIRTVLQS